MTLLKNYLWFMKVIKNEKSDLRFRLQDWYYDKIYGIETKVLILKVDGYLTV